MTFLLVTLNFIEVLLEHYGNPIIDWDKGHLHLTDGDIYR